MIGEPNEFIRLYRSVVLTAFEDSSCERKSKMDKVNRRLARSWLLGGGRDVLEVFSLAQLPYDVEAIQRFLDSGLHVLDCTRKMGSRNNRKLCTRQDEFEEEIDTLFT